MNEITIMINDFEDFEWLRFPFHKEEVKQILTRAVSTRILNVHCANINKVIKANKKRRVRQADSRKVATAPDEGLDDINLNDWPLLTGVKGKDLLTLV